MKYRYIRIILLFFIIGNIYSQDQSKLYRFRMINQDNGVFYTFFHNLDTNEAEVRAIGNEDYTAENGGYLESFIIKPMGDFGKVMIASAKAPEFFLKRRSNAYNGEITSSDNPIKKIEFAKLEKGDDIDLYTWNIKITTLNRIHNTYFVRIQSSERDMTLALNRFDDKNNVILAPVRRRRFLRKREQVFIMESINNVF